MVCDTSEAAKRMAQELYPNCPDSLLFPVGRGQWVRGEKRHRWVNRAHIGTKDIIIIYHICHIIYTNFLAFFWRNFRDLREFARILLEQRLGFFGGKKQIHGDPGKSGSRLGAKNGTGLEGVNIHHPLGFSLGTPWRRCWYVNIYILFQGSRMNG